MLVTIDIGNSHTVLGAWQEDELLCSCRVASDTQMTSDQWNWLILDWLKKKSLSINDVHSAVYASVLPPVENSLAAGLEKIFSRVLKLDANGILPFTFDYAGVSTLGADRIANAVAAVLYYRDSCLIFDFGTAITACLITQKIYRGGVIVPGIITSLNALTHSTAQLPRVGFSVQKEVLGKTTIDSIEKGVYFSARGLVKELIEQFRREAKKYTDDEIPVIAGGGIAESLGFGHEFFDVTDTNLTLRGLYQYYLLNYANKKE